MPEDVVMREVYESRSEGDTERIAAGLSEKLSGGEIIAFNGGLGMGKTAFVRGLARALGFKGEVSSPTFALMNEYIGGRLAVYHFDMYRIETWDDLYSSGYFEYSEMGGVLAAEWSENIESALPDDAIRVTFERKGENERVITIERREADENTRN